jgi:hypothetical protein
VAWLDHAGVDGTHRELVDALAVDLERYEMTLRVGRSDIGRDVLSERMEPLRKALVEDEAPRIGMAKWDDPE